MKVVLYARVRNVNELEKLKEQEHQLLWYAERNDLTVVGSYSDIGFDRTGYNKMINELDNVDLILITEISRISRKCDELTKFVFSMKDKNIQWYAINEHYNSTSPAGNLYTNFMLSFLEDYEKSEGL